MTRLSCHRFRSNQVRLALSLLAYNLGNLWRRLTLPKRIENWSLTSLQQRLVKTGGRLVKHARYYWLLLAEGHLTRRRFGAMLGGSRCYRYRRDRWIVVQSAAESVYKVVGVRRGVAKTGHKMGRFWPCRRGWQIDGRIVSRCRECARQVYHGTVFEVKKEIPVELQEADGCPGRL
jgi:DDE family transposase